MKNFIENIKYFLFKHENLIMWIFCMLISMFMLGALLSREINFNLSSKQQDNIEIVEKVDTLQCLSNTYER